VTRESYPKPPWQIYGSGLAIPCIVASRHVRVPEELAIVHTAGRTLGMLVYLEYASPSPIAHHELIWLSAIVRCRDRSYRIPNSFGPMYYAARMYVDDALAIDAGRNEWALPKTFARFRRTRNHIAMSAEDGTELSFAFKPRGFTFTAPTNVTTLQKDFGRVVCFKARGRAQVQLATYKIESFFSEHPEWKSFQSGIVLPGVASHLRSFETTLRAPIEITRGLDSIAPAPSMV
jgi:hypothetical protein